MLYAAIFLVSAVGIAYQLALMRIFSIAQWHHFAYMIISMAMLGFGASGTVLALARGRLAGREARALSFGAALLTIALVVCHALAQRIPFETFELTTQPRQVLWLSCLYLVLAVPFLLVASCIALGFFLVPRQVGRLYGVNMMGSGVGALATVALLYLVHPARLPALLALPVAGAYLLVTPRSRAALLCAGGLLVFTVLAAAGAIPGLEQDVRVSAYKGLSYAKQFPDARVVAERVNPLAVVTAVASAQIRETPGQISNYPMSELGELPEQIGLYFDAGGVSPVNRFDGDLAAFRWLDHVTNAVAYRLVERPHVLVVGAGGGTDILAALAHGARHVTAIEINPAIPALLREDLAALSGNPYAWETVTPVIADGRAFLEATDQRFDLIQIALLDSFTASAAGVHALSESYLYTVEALALYLERLTENGALAIKGQLKTPPRDALKLFATAVEASERVGIARPERHLVFIRSWNTGTIVVTRVPLTDAQIAAVRAFCRDRWFDLCHAPGLRAEETNRYTVLESPVYHDFAQSVLFSDRARAYRDALFYLRPATDDRPYFFQFFKWTSLDWLLAGMGAEWVPFVEWGYLTLIATLAQALVAGAVLVCLPLVTLRRLPGAARGAARWTALYFTALGLGYMFLEIAFIQKFMLYLAYPVYAVAVVLTAFLIFSGLGSLAANRIRERRGPALGAVVGVMILLAAGYQAGLDDVFRVCAALPDPAKIALSVALLAPLAFLMGVPFPLGLQWVSDRAPGLLPWVWGINGCASIIGACLATILAVHLGFRLVIVVSAAIYVLAWFALCRFPRTESNSVEDAVTITESGAETA